MLRQGADGAHQRRIIPVIWRQRAAHFVLVIAVGVLSDVNPRDELKPVEIGESVDAPAGLRLGRIVLVGNPARRVQMPRIRPRPMFGPVRPFGL